MKECLIRNINPKNSTNPEVPRDMEEAISKFFNVIKGKWENATTQPRREIAKNLQLLVDGDKSSPNLTVYDRGEGQNPDNFENTFLSMHRGNKMDVPFVQGKYNMGSTGAVVFCGGHRYQLIISRRNMDLKDSSKKIGFTLVRRHILTTEEESRMKSTWYEYLTIDGQIPCFESDELDLGLHETPFIDGSIVKMYSYELSRGCRSDATLDLWRELNTLLYEASIPVLIYEKRYTRNHTPTKLMLGNKTRIANDERDKKRYTLSYSICDNADLGDAVPIEVTIFNHDVGNSEFIRQKSVVFLMNGQTQGIENRTFISTDLGFRALKDYILISVDCTKIKLGFRQDLFMASRDRLKQGKNYDILLQEIIDILKHDDNLKQINQEYKGKLLHESKDDKELIEKLFSDLKENKDIRNLFVNRNGDFAFLTKKSKKTAKENNGTGKKEEKKQLKRFPSYFKVKGLEEKDGKLIKAVPIGGKSSIRFETDVENEYFTRNVEQGSLEISICDYNNPNGGHGGHGKKYPSTVKDVLKVQRSGPFEGEIKLSFESTNCVEVGDVFPLSIKMISPSGDINVIVWIKIEKEHTQSSPSKQKEEPDFNLPKAIRVFKEKSEENDITWQDCGMRAEDVVKFEVGEAGSIEEIRINMDSNLMKKEMNKRNINVNEVSNRYFAAVYSHSLMLYSTLMGYYSQEKIEGLELESLNEIKDDLNIALEFVFQYYGSFLLSFNAELPDVS